MASASRESRYRRAVDGSAARKVDWEAGRAENTHEGTRQTSADADIRRWARRTALSEFRKRVGVRVSPLSVLFAAAAAVMMTLVVLSYVELATISHDTAKLQSSLGELNDKNARLMSEHQQMFDLSSVKEMAEAMGMVKPSGGQIFYFNMPDGDSAVVYPPEEPDVMESIWSEIQDKARSLFNPAPNVPADTTVSANGQTVTSPQEPDSQVTVPLPRDTEEDGADGEADPQIEEKADGGGNDEGDA